MVFVDLPIHEFRDVLDRGHQRGVVRELAVRLMDDAVPLEVHGVRPDHHDFGDLVVVHQRANGREEMFDGAVVDLVCVHEIAFFWNIRRTFDCGSKMSTRVRLRLTVKRIPPRFA